MQYLFIDGDDQLAQAKENGLDLAARSWYEAAPTTRLVIVWSVLRDGGVLRRANEVFDLGVEFRVWKKGTAEFEKVSNVYGSDALVVDSNEPFLDGFTELVSTMRLADFVDTMSNEPQFFECANCGRQTPAPAYRWRLADASDHFPSEQLCTACGLPGSNSSELSTERLLQMIEAGIETTSTEARAAVSSLRWKLAMSTDDQNVRLVIARHHDRAEVGLKKYGFTTENNPLGVVQWLNHFSEELADAEVYAQAVIVKIEAVEHLVKNVLANETVLSGQGEVDLKRVLSILQGES